MNVDRMDDDYIGPVGSPEDNDRFRNKKVDRYKSVIGRLASQKFNGDREPVRLAMLELLEEQPLFDSGSSKDMGRLIAKAEALASVLRGLDDLKHGRFVEGPDLSE